MKVSILQKISRWLAANASLTVIAVAVFTFFVPDAFNWVRGNTQTVILGIIMLTMGLTLTTQDFRILAHRPWDIFIGACAQFIIMPCVAYLLVHVFVWNLPWHWVSCWWAAAPAVYQVISCRTSVMAMWPSRWE